MFVSGRLGNANDMWLAHGRDHKWTEFLFTGQPFKHSRMYGGDTPPSPGACALDVAGDKIVLRPPDMHKAVESERLQKQMSDPKLTNAQRQAYSTQYYKVAQQLANVIEKPLTLVLADLRRDWDGVGQLLAVQRHQEPLPLLQLAPSLPPGYPARRQREC